MRHLDAPMSMRRKDRRWEGREGKVLPRSLVGLICAIQRRRGGRTPWKEGGMRARGYTYYYIEERYYLLCTNARGPASSPSRMKGNKGGGG